MHAQLMDKVFITFGIFTVCKGTRLGFPIYSGVHVPTYTQIRMCAQLDVASIGFLLTIKPVIRPLKYRQKRS